MGSRVSGSKEAIALTQQSPSRYYQRPDADYVTYDPSRTSLTGWAGRAMLSKTAGLWRPNIQVQAYSPGYETNDAGFMQRSDIISTHALVQYVNEESTKHFRNRNAWFGVYINQNFGGDTIERGVFVDTFGSLQSFWNYRAALFVAPGSFYDRATRGGPTVRSPRSWSSDLSLGSDDRKTFFLTAERHLEGAA